MTNEQIQALKAQMARKHRDWSGSVMRTCDYCGHYKYTVMEDGGRVAKCASCCDGEHATNLANVAETLLAEREADKALIAELKGIRAAAEKLVRCKGRYHSEQNYRALAALFGVNTPELPPLDNEARTLTVKLPNYSEFAIVHFTGCSDDYAKGWVDGKNTVGKAYATACAAAGITLVVGGE